MEVWTLGLEESLRTSKLWWFASLFVGPSVSSMRRALQRLWWCNKIHQVSSPRLCWGETLTKAAKTVASTSSTLHPARGMASTAGEKVQPKKRKAKNEFDGGEIRTEVQDDEHWTTIRAGAAWSKIHCCFVAVWRELWSEQKNPSCFVRLHGRTFPNRVVAMPDFVPFGRNHCMQE